MNTYDVIGLLAFISGILIKLPQIIKIIRTKSATDISYLSLFIEFINIILWIIYSMYLINNILILSSICHLVMNISEVGLKLYFDYNHAEK
jgi:MtN3 and saliva related transmembrane protein